MQFGSAVLVACMAHRRNFARHGSPSKEAWHKEAFCTADTSLDFVIYRINWSGFQNNSPSVCEALSKTRRALAILSYLRKPTAVLDWRPELQCEGRLALYSLLCCRCTDELRFSSAQGWTNAHKHCPSTETPKVKDSQLEYLPAGKTHRAASVE